MASLGYSLLKLKTEVRLGTKIKNYLHYLPTSYITLQSCNLPDGLGPLPGPSANGRNLAPLEADIQNLIRAILRPLLKLTGPKWNWGLQGKENMYKHLWEDPTFHMQRYTALNPGIGTFSFPL